MLANNSSAPYTMPSTSIPTPTTSTSSPATSAKTSLACPFANGTTYTATNRPLPTLPGALTNNSFEFLVACDTNWVDYDSVKDLQQLGGITSLQDCMDACARFTWQARPDFYKTWGCSGAAWTGGLSGETSAPADSCVLKANVSQSTHNDSYAYPAFDGVILLYT